VVKYLSGKLSKIKNEAMTAQGDGGVEVLLGRIRVHTSEEKTHKY
jgi:hypothetical protein